MMIRWEDGDSGSPRACGVDGEQVRRFAKLVGVRDPWPQIFSAREAAHAAAAPDPAAALCASFCCKEALVKALEAAYPYRECELFLEGGQEEQDLVLSPGIRESHRVLRARARVFSAREGELVAVVCLYGAPRG